MRSFNEEAYQAELKKNTYKGLELLEKENPEKAREIFNSYLKLNEQIDVRLLSLPLLTSLLRRTPANSSRKLSMSMRMTSCRPSSRKCTSCRKTCET